MKHAETRFQTSSELSVWFPQKTNKQTKNNFFHSLYSYIRNAKPPVKTHSGTSLWPTLPHIFPLTGYAIASITDRTD